MLINVNIYKDCCGILDSHQIILKIQAFLCALKSESECEYLKNVLKVKAWTFQLFLIIKINQCLPD